MPSAIQMCLAEPFHPFNESFSSRVYPSISRVKHLIAPLWGEQKAKTSAEMLFSFLAAERVNNLADGPKLPPAIYIHFVSLK